MMDEYFNQADHDHAPARCLPDRLLAGLQHAASSVRECNGRWPGEWVGWHAVSMCLAARWTSLIAIIQNAEKSQLIRPTSRPPNLRRGLHFRLILQSQQRNPSRHKHYRRSHRLPPPPCDDSHSDRCVPMDSGLGVEEHYQVSDRLHFPVVGVHLQVIKGTSGSTTDLGRDTHVQTVRIDQEALKRVGCPHRKSRVAVPQLVL
jgi:hypothetical protein